MAARLGNKEKFYIRTVIQVSSQDVVRYMWLGCETANSLNHTQEAVETSDKSTDWAQFIGGKRGGTIEATAYSDNDDSQQHAALMGLHNGSRVQVFVGQITGHTSDSEDDSPNEGFLAYGIVSGISDTNDFGAVASRTFNLTIDGETIQAKNENDDYDIRFEGFINATGYTDKGDGDEYKSFIRCYRVSRGSTYRITGNADVQGVAWPSFAFAAFTENTPYFGIENLTVFELYGADVLSVDRTYTAPEDGYILLALFSPQVEEQTTGTWSIRRTL